MTARATWNGTVLAESDETIIVEGNHYFPRAALNAELVSASSTETLCPWKGTASYLNLVVDGKTNEDAVWYYPNPLEAAEEIRDYVAFWRGVEVEVGEGDGRQGPLPPKR